MLTSRTVNLMTTLALALLLSGCMAHGNPEPRHAVAASKVHCAREVPTGSHRSVVTCRTEAQMRADKEDARRILRKPRVLQSL